MLLHCFPKLFCRFVTSVANKEIDESFLISINSNPYPTIVFFEPILEQRHCLLLKIFLWNENPILQDINARPVFFIAFDLAVDFNSTL
jgi:hypothetical protein